MALITLSDAHLAYGDLPLLDEAALSIEPGERVGLIGRNGTGKSSLLSVLAGKQLLDDGQIQRQDGLIVHYVEQEPILPEAPTFRESLIARGNIESIADEKEKWRLYAKLDENLSRFELNPDGDPKLASGGERKRAALALAFTLAPQLMLLDEPTNHLDMRAISLLENICRDELKNQRSLVVITHDRAFLDNVATRIVELDRGTLRSYPGNFSAYEARKEEELAAEALERRRFDKFWAQEEVWIRKGIEARRTRNEGRVRRLEALRRERAARREQMGSIRLAIDAGEKSGKIVAEVTGLSKSFGNHVVVKDLDFTLMRGDRLGLIGPNGAGKSTLIKLILGKLKPDAGKVKLGTNLQIAYFDQLREQLDLNKTVAKIDEAAEALKTIAKTGRKILFVATKKQVKDVVAEKAASINMPYVNERWAGGMLTNFPTIRKAVKKMANIDRLLNDGTFSNLSKRELLQVSRQRAKLEKNLGSIADMARLPVALFVVDVMKEHIAVKEANRLGIPVFGIVDTNSDPKNVDYVIPANDDAKDSVDAILTAVCGAIAEALEERKAEKADDKAAAEQKDQPKKKAARKDEAE